MDGEISIVSCSFSFSWGEVFPIPTPNNDLVARQPGTWKADILPLEPAQTALGVFEQLIGRIQHEAQAYLEWASKRADPARLEAAEWLLQRLADRSEDIRTIRFTIAAAPMGDQAAIAEIIQAQIRMFDLFQAAVGNNPDNYDRIWAWARDALPVLQESLQRFPQLPLESTDAGESGLENCLSWNTRAQQRGKHSEWAGRHIGGMHGTDAHEGYPTAA